MITVVQKARPLISVMADDVKEHFFSLSKEDRRLRFGYPIKDEALKQYIEKALEESSTQWFIAYDVHPMMAWLGKVVGISQVCIDKTGTGAEIGISVDSAYRGHGVASKLMKKSFRRSAMMGVEKIHILTLTENQAMKRLAQKFDVKFNAPYGCEIEGVSNLRYTHYDIAGYMLEECMDLNKQVMDSIPEIQEELKVG